MSDNAEQPRKRDIAVSFSTRISLPTRDLLDAVALREGLSLRETVEQAIEFRWGSGSGRLRKPALFTVVDNAEEVPR